MTSLRWLSVGVPARTALQLAYTSFLRIGSGTGATR
jgi:hypothetical protein